MSLDDSRPKFNLVGDPLQCFDPLPWPPFCRRHDRHRKRHGPCGLSSSGQRLCRLLLSGLRGLRSLHDDRRWLRHSRLLRRMHDRALSGPCGWPSVLPASPGQGRGQACLWRWLRKVAATVAAAAAVMDGYGGCGDGYGCGGMWRWSLRRRMQRRLLGSAGCSGCTGGQQGGGDVIYNGPAAADQPAPPADTRQRGQPRGNSQYRLVSQRATGGGNSGAAAFDQGLASFRARSFTNALQSFEAAATAEPDNAIYQYYRALTSVRPEGAEGGNEALQQAIELEKREAVPHWGKRMERVQGRGRVWIEKGSPRSRTGAVEAKSQ